MFKVGVLIDNLGASQLAYYTILNANKLAENMEADPIIFYSNLAKICLAPKVALMPITEAWGYSGVLIATDLRSASRLITFPSSTHKVFYLNDIEWTRNHVSKEFQTLYNIYSNNELKFIVRSKSHEKVLKNCWGVNCIGMVENMDIKEILKCLNILQ